MEKKFFDRPKMNCWAKTVRLTFIPFCYIIRETQAGLLTHYKKAFMKTTPTSVMV